MDIVGTAPQGLGSLLLAFPDRLARRLKTREPEGVGRVAVRLGDDPGRDSVNGSNIAAASHVVDPEAEHRPELRLRRALTARGIRGYRCHLSSLPGTPDLAFTHWRVAVFVDGVLVARAPGHVPEESADLLGSEDRQQQGARRSYQLRT